MAHTSRVRVSSVVLVASLALHLFFPECFSSSVLIARASASESDVDLLEFPLNLEYLEAEFFLFGALGYGLDMIAPKLAGGGDPPIGAKFAKLDNLVRDVIIQFGLQEVGHLRAIKSTVKGFPRPLLNLSSSAFAEVMDAAFGRTLNPPFDPYANSINFLLASYVIPYVGLTGYVGTNPLLHNSSSRKLELLSGKTVISRNELLLSSPSLLFMLHNDNVHMLHLHEQLVAGLLAVESGQDAVIRALLYERKAQLVQPYGVTVGEFTDRISNLRNKLGKAGLKDEGLVVPRKDGAEGEVSGNILAGDKDSLAYSRTPKEILRIVYGTGDEHVPGGFYPKGARGRIATSYLKQSI
ncbi:unnamed protein product [Sphenostylis stenocarpa]|uniref:Desiccation-related protein PCC13-62 n=1 Tax=Sphenostylis stenocarpa TaxID=92480 RepID=A0AA86VKD3_9FABA|nr:unnamed protein product [Sphenostylis stenocarpa]